MKQLLAHLLLFLLPLSMYAQKKIPNLIRQQHDIFLKELLNKNEQLKKWLGKKDALNIQIIYTRIDRDKNNTPSFTDFTFNLNNQYFYPASTVKMPIAFLALEKLNELSEYNIDANTTMLTDSSAEKQSLVYTHPSSENSNPTIAHYIKQIFLVSDNDAYNRLYEFLGQEYIQKKLQEKGYKDAAIRHRLQIALTPEQNKATNAIQFIDTAGNVLYNQPAQFSKAIFPTYEAKLGKGFYKGNKLINEPFDFSTKNRIYLQDLHHILRTVLFKDFIQPKQRFKHTKTDEQFLLQWMSAYPKESKFPYYDTTNYWDSYCKFLLLGSEKKTPPSNIRIFNKVGDAYGFLIDNAYIIDTENNVEFMLSATINCNTDGIYNDDKYEYETIGFPFMKQLGETIYQYELKRKRKYQPNLTKFKLQY